MADERRSHSTQDLILRVNGVRRKADLIPLYRENMSNPEVDWSAVNHAIVKRWSLSALRDIKRGAWATVPPLAAARGEVVA